MLESFPKLSGMALLWSCSAYASERFLLEIFPVVARGVCWLVCVTPSQGGVNYNCSTVTLGEKKRWVRFPLLRVCFLSEVSDFYRRNGEYLSGQKAHLTGFASRDCDAVGEGELKAIRETKM